MINAPIITHNTQNYLLDSFIIMKVGSHGKESFQEIIERKNKEQLNTGFMLWGYSGNLLDVIETRNFFSNQEKGRKFILMSETKSPFQNSPEKSSFFSLNKIDWHELPKSLYTTGCDKTVICRNLVKTNLYLDISLFVVATGPSKGKKLSEYLRFRTDKACAVFKNGIIKSQESLIQIDWIAEILPPYTIFLSKNKPLQSNLFIEDTDSLGVFKDFI